MHAITHSKRQVDYAELRIPIGSGHLFNIRFSAGYGIGDSRNDAALVFNFHPQVYGKFAFNTGVPTQRDELFRIITNLGHVVAGLSMNNHAAASTDVTNNRITGQRMTTFGVRNQQAFCALERKR